MIGLEQASATYGPRAAKGPQNGHETVFIVTLENFTLEMDKAVCKAFTRVWKKESFKNLKALAKQMFSLLGNTYIQYVNKLSR